MPGVEEDSVRAEGEAVVTALFFPYRLGAASEFAR